MSAKRTGLIGLLIVMSGFSGVCHGKPLAAGQGKKGAWWMRQTAMSKDGTLDLANKPWWPKAVELKVGEQFVVDRKGAAAGRMLVRCERFDTRSRKKVVGIVWVIDDDNDGSINSGGDVDSDCYVVDYDCDGVVDRIVDYIDNDGDNDADEMDIRYFVKGQLRYSWFGDDLDDDSLMWSLGGYEYAGTSFFESDPYGDNMIYLNKLNPNTGKWAPFSECPFAFYDTDGDGYSETVVRISAASLAFDIVKFPDYANSFRRITGDWSPEMDKMGAVNVRYSFDIDGGSSKKTPLHYDFGFNLIGAAAYDYPGMYKYNAKRRPPQIVCVTPYKDLREIADNYNAEQTGFSWNENFDDTLNIGYEPKIKRQRNSDDWRWEGVFWTWERRFMHNTGNPTLRWNIRREWSSKEAKNRKLYYSGVDKRIHLYGAEEGWIKVGHFADLPAIGEIRMFDSDGNGYFDRWEYYSADTASVPVRVSTVRDEKAELLEWNPEAIGDFYTSKVLPEAMSENTGLMEAMSKVLPFEMSADLQKAVKIGPVNFQRYAQDVARELQYQNLRRHFMEKANLLLRTHKHDDLRKVKVDQMQSSANSSTAWLLIRLLADLDIAYGQGDYGSAIVVLEKIAVFGQTVSLKSPTSF